MKKLGIGLMIIGFIIIAVIVVFVVDFKAVLDKIFRTSQKEQQKQVVDNFSKSRKRKRRRRLRADYSNPEFVALRG